MADHASIIDLRPGEKNRQMVLKQHIPDGDKVVTTGVEVNRIQIKNGIPPLDLILGGGIPENRVTEIFGLAGSCKSMLASLIVASKQQISPELRCVWIAAEPFGPTWAKKFGVGVKKLLVVNPDHGEQVIDICEKLMEADDCGLVVLDSLAAMVTKKELENPAEIGDPGGPGRVNKKLFNIVMAAQKKAAEKGRATTFVFTNQMRSKFGAHGSQIISSGGPFPKHAAAIRLRHYAKDVFDPAIHASLPARNEVRVVVENHKIPVAEQECIFEIAILKQAGLEVGQVNSNWKITSPALS
jgi:recombination protein RecA